MSKDDTRRTELEGALDRALETEDDATQLVVASSHALMAFELELDPSLTVTAVSKALHSHYKARGYNHAPSTWAAHFRCGEWLVEQTGGYHWLKDRSYTQHRLAAGKMTIKQLDDYKGVLRSNDNGEEGESWKTTLRRLTTQVTNEGEILEVKERQAVRTHKRKHLKVIHDNVVEGAEALLRAVAVLDEGVV